MIIKIKVTKEVIERSRMCGTLLTNPLDEIVNSKALQDKHRAITTNLQSNCMISLAVRDIFPNAVTNNSNIYLKGIITACDCTITLPRRVKKAIIEFDHMKPDDRLFIKPFSFDVEVSDEIIDLIGINQVYKVLSESKTLELVNI